MRALVLSGGGSHGAYECGAIQWLLNHKQIKYDLLCGISVGALNCAWLSQYELGQEKAAAHHLKNIWYKINDDKIFKNHKPFRKLHALWKESIVDSSPLFDLIDRNYHPDRTLTANRRLIVGAVSLTSGKYVEFDQNSTHITNAIKASAAYPVYFTPVHFDKQIWADGGIKTIAPLDAAVHAGATHIDMVVTSPADSKAWLDKKPNALEIALRVLELTYEEILDDDLKVCIHKHPSTTIKVLRPAQAFTESSTSFSHKNIVELINLGLNDAQIIWP